MFVFATPVVPSDLDGLCMHGQSFDLVVLTEIGVGRWGLRDGRGWAEMVDRNGTVTLNARSVIAPCFNNYV